MKASFLVLAAFASIGSLFAVDPPTDDDYGYAASSASSAANFIWRPTDNLAYARWDMDGHERSEYARWDHTATLLPNGTVLVAGGFDTGGYSPSDSAELARRHRQGARGPEAGSALDLMS